VLHRLALPLVATLSLATACKAQPAPERDAATTSAPTLSTPTLGAAPTYNPDWSRRDAGRAAESSGDPHRGQVSLAQATAGLRGDGPLLATITTDRGELRCLLLADKAPIAVANFVGLANGTRAWKTRGGWQRTPAYDGSSFDRVTPGLAIIVSAPSSGQRGAPGYTIIDERWPGMRHDRAGLLCTRGIHKDRVGASFLITDGPTPNLDTPADDPRKPAFTVFGSCEPLALIHQLAASPASHGRPDKRIVIERIRVRRGQR
jgi:peptidyl-prolyl cis-trans isomerase A (cyclophilin A)